MHEKPSSFPAGSDGNFAIIPSKRGRLSASVIAGLICLIVYSANFRSISAGDTYPARYLPFAMWRWHTVLLDPIADVTAQGWTPIKPRKDTDPPRSVDPQEAFWVVRLPSGHSISLYPVVAPILVSPLYLPAVAYLGATGWDQLDRVARIMEKISASLIAAVSAALFYLLLRRQTSPKSAALLTFAYAFGTTTWMIGSQAMWQHTTAELLVVIVLLLLTSECTRRRAIAAGVMLGLIVCNRPPDALIAVALGIYGLFWARKFEPLLIVAAILPVVPLVIYNVNVASNIAGGYGLLGDPSFLRHNLFSGIAGLLFSPTKGLFVFSPFLLFVPFCVPQIWRDPKARGIAIAALTAATLQLLLYGLADWRQGGSWGPRWLTELTPLLIWMLAPAWVAMRTPLRVVFVLAVAVSVAIEAIGAFWYTGASNVLIYASAASPTPMRSAWEIRNAPFISELKHAHAPFDLTTNVHGFLDAMTTGYGAGGRELGLDGWALAGEHSPAEVLVLRDGHPAESATGFAARPDVTNALGVKAPSGWHVTVPTNRLQAGDHSISILARAFPGTDLHLLAQRRFEVPSGSGFGFRASLAAETIASSQQPLGYWLTSFTNQLRFESPGVEMNTYLPAVMTDLLAPSAPTPEMQASIQRARQFLTAQIEANGLVRYHGLPDAPTIGVLGCAITPDADDTALVWRIAPSVRADLIPGALKTMTAFQTPQGLYRTWLAPNDRYECIDRGSDPDPADIGIQMHIFLFLAKADPPAARALCAAIQRSVNDDRVWVYYKRAPLIPILRRADLQAAGCTLVLPAPRVESTVEGQELWIAAARMLQGEHSRSDLRQLLERISADDFAYLRRSPPLLYHNDLTASVPRFYWSREYGYGLWLRLYSKLVEGGAS